MIKSKDIFRENVYRQISKNKSFRSSRAWNWNFWKYGSAYFQVYISSRMLIDESNEFWRWILYLYQI